MGAWPDIFLSCSLRWLTLQRKSSTRKKIGFACSLTNFKPIKNPQTLWARGLAWIWRQPSKLDDRGSNPRASVNHYFSRRLFSEVRFFKGHFMYPRASVSGSSDLSEEAQTSEGSSVSFVFAPLAHPLCFIPPGVDTRFHSLFHSPHKKP